MTRARADQTKRKKRERADSPPPVDPGVRVHVELWVKEGSGIASTTSAAVLLVNDLLLAEGASDCETSGSSLYAKLPDASRAVIAAGHLHSAMEGFSQACKEVGMRYACLLNTAEMPRSEIETPASNTLAGGVESGTVLIAGDLCDAMRLLPGVVLRSIDYAPRSAQLANQRIAELVRPSEFTELLRDVAFRETPATKDQGNSLAAEAESSRPPGKPVFTGQKRYWTIGGAVAACLLAGIVSISVLARRSSPPAAAPATPDTTAPEVKIAPTPPVATKPISTVNTVKEVVPPKNNALVEKRKADPPRELPKKPEKPKEEARPRTPSSGGALTFDSSEIPRMNAMAEREAGNGNYDKAINIFQSVLRNDPNNSDARRGIEKARRNKGSGQP